MTRSDTLAAIASRCRRSHAAALLAVGYITLDSPKELLDDLLGALEDHQAADELLNHLIVVERLLAERHGNSSRLS